LARTGDFFFLSTGSARVVVFSVSCSTISNAA
jgi:hypothetical protein